MQDLFNKILQYAPNYLSALAALFSGPKEFIATRLQKNLETEWIDALVFLAISIGLSTLLLTWIDPAAVKDLWTVLGKTELISIFLTACGAVAVRFSWWLVGGKADAKSFFITYAYASAGDFIIFAIFFVVACGVFKWQDPELFAKLQDPELLAEFKKTSAVKMQPDWLGHSSLSIYTGIVFMGFVSTLIWWVLVWGAFRRLTALGKFRSCLALTINLLLIIPLTAVGFFIQFALD